ncbi:hypothetical protein H0E87_003575 [Populus deltoides]|uniref:Uncharacterized protein n=1 Tax=Populus deltoides TaxID=3696 RepID=A0A8T2ZZK9_POPDE|nr:hypothetical protein H0E87_003575 [Populus deltoides]
MANSHLGITLLSLILFFSLSKTTLSQDPPRSVFEILPKFGLPSGLLPNTVKSYSLSDDGNFTVYLEKECYVEFDYLVYYEKKITGKLGYGSITNLKGIQVQKFFLWLDVDEIKVDLPPSDSIYFQVGWINKKLDADQFKTVHSCRAGVSSGSCRGLWKQFLELPAPDDDVQMLLTETKLPKGTARGSCVCRDCSTSPVHAPHRRALDIALPRRAGALPLVPSTSK